MTRLGILALSLLVASCGGKEEEEDTTPCGDSLECTSSEFCLSFLPDGASSGEEEYSCEPLPAGCESFDHMCFDDPDVCIEDWALDVCGANTWASGCVAFGGLQEAFCEEGPAYSSR
jgi:hypothetical protein